MKQKVNNLYDAKVTITTAPNPSFQRTRKLTRAAELERCFF
jgi:hypothetical protein